MEGFVELGVIKVVVDGVSLLEMKWNRLNKKRRACVKRNMISGCRCVGLRLRLKKK